MFFTSIEVICKLNEGYLVGLLDVKTTCKEGSMVAYQPELRIRTMHPSFIYSQRCKSMDALPFLQPIFYMFNRFSRFSHDSHSSGCQVFNTAPGF